MLRFSNQLGYVIGVEIGPNSVELALSDINAQMLARDSGAANVSDGPTALLGEITGRIRNMIQHQGLCPEQIVGIGVGGPFHVDFEQGRVIAPPPLIPAWDGFLIPRFMQQAFPHAGVWADKDANLAALGELRAGAGIDVDDFIFVRIGTYLGAGIIADGQVHRGKTGSAGDIGHIHVDRNGPVCHCGKIGCLEIMAAAPAMVSRAMDAAQNGSSQLLAKKMELQHGTLRSEDVDLAAREGDRVAIEIIQSSGKTIGEVLAAQVNFFNPSLILVGGTVANIGNQLLYSIRQAVLGGSSVLATHELAINISTLGAEAGVIGAVHLALDHLFTVTDIRRDNS